MKLYELAKLTHKERFKIITDLRQNDVELSVDLKIVEEIFHKTIEDFKRPHNLLEI